MPKKKRLRTWVVITLLLLFLIGTIYYSCQIVLWKIHVDNNNKIQKKINDSVKVIESNEDVKYEIDFNILKKRNPDTIGYLNVNNTNINYIIVKGKDNSYYLNHNYDKKWNRAGWIFADYHNKFDETDRNIIIYGHNMKDGSMFETLKDVLTKEWYTNDNNHIITLATEKGTYHYQVFSTYSIVPEDYYINTQFSTDSNFYKFIKTLEKRSIYNYEVDLSKEDKILTLSSCLGDGSKRVVLHAKLLIENKEEELENE